MMQLSPRYLARYKDIGLLFLRHAKPAILEQTDFGRFADDADAKGDDRPEALARALERMGPTFVKLGQVISTRGDLLPTRYLSALERLQDDVEPIPYAQVHETVEKELGIRISTAFQHFEERPLASASIGQVHRARTREGVEVVVKVQRPGIRQQIEIDIEALENIAAYADANTELGRRYHFSGIVEQFRRSLSEELDYKLEAQNLLRINQALQESRRLFAPQPIPDYSSTRVLTLTHIDGVKVTELSGVVKTELDGKGLADEIFSTYLRHVLVDGFYHADPHPGNLLVTRDGRVALIDLGMVGRIGQRMRDELFRLLTGISDEDGDRAAEAALRIGVTDRGRMDIHSFHSEVCDLVARSNLSTIEETRFGSVVMDVMHICANYNVRIPREISMLGKTLLHLDRVGMALAPNFNPNESIRRNVETLARKRAWKTLRSGSFLSGLMELKEIVVQTPRRINDILEIVSNNQLRLDVDAVDEKALIQGFQKIANRITVGVVLGSMIMGASLMMDIESRFQLFGYPGLPIILFLFAAICGVGLLYSIWRRDL
jgi:predicted unusual protein kinase regulating ubiquinone biosynthesis (AarF/ABC1/UbiB family)